MRTPLTLFLATFAVVFLLGLQQLNVQHGHRLAAAITSVLISAATLVQFKLLPGPTTALDIAGYMAGGVLGIVASMTVYPRLQRVVASALRRQPGAAR